MILLLLSLLFGSTPRGHAVSSYERRELTIPMRDGTRLFAAALIPAQQSKPLPIILIRTPFDASRELKSAEPPFFLKELAQDGYIFVVEDIRGRGKSEGQFITLRPQSDSGGVDESTDAYDTIDWLVKNLPNNSGKVGVMGVSYRGWLAALAGVNAHPAVKAISPQAPVADAWLGDDFFHQGAFRQTQGLLYSAYVEGDGSLEIPVYDQYTFYSRFSTLDSLAKATKVLSQPSWIGFREHPAWDSYWQSKALQNVLTNTKVPMLFVGGFWDEEDILGPQLMYRTLEKSDSSRLNRIVLGPWFHNTWITPKGDSLGPIALGDNTSAYFREHIQRPWFAHYLHDDNNVFFPEAQVFETGSNEWRAFDTWPPKEAVARNIYLRENGRLSFDPPTTRSTQFDQYVSDPAHPVPYTPRPDDGSGAHWLQIDQRFVDGRPDVVTWQSDPLAEDFVIAGDVSAHLFASTTGTDADWVVKLIDVYPDTVSETPALGGYELIVNADVMRGRYSKSFAHAMPVTANAVTPFNVDMHQQLYRFRKGHRLMVQVQSTWFPLYDRNPQTFVPNIFNAKASDYRAATHRVWHTVKYPSRITVQVPIL